MRKRTRRGNLPPPTDRLSAPLPDEDYGVWLFCSGCGGVLPCLTTAIPLILPGLEACPPGTFIHLAECDLCGDRLGNPHLVPLRRS